MFFFKNIFSYFISRLQDINPLPPSDAVQEQKNIILDDLFSSVLSQLKKYHPPWKPEIKLSCHGKKEKKNKKQGSNKWKLPCYSFSDFSRLI